MSITSLNNHRITTAPASERTTLPSARRALSVSIALNALQANAIMRLTEENQRLRNSNHSLQERIDLLTTSLRDEEILIRQVDEANKKFEEVSRYAQSIVSHQAENVALREQLQQTSNSLFNAEQKIKDKEIYIRQLSELINKTSSQRDEAVFQRETAERGVKVLYDDMEAERRVTEEDEKWRNSWTEALCEEVSRLHQEIEELRKSIPSGNSNGPSAPRTSPNIPG